MATNDFLDLEVTYTKIGLVTVLATILWLYPKYFKVPIVWEIAGGLCATSMVLTAAASSNRIEKRKRYERAERAAQDDLFTMELAHTVFAQQQQFEQQFQPSTPVEQARPAFSSAMPLANAPVAAHSEPLPQAIAHPTPILQNNQPEIFNIQELRHYPSAIIFGPQGSGKTTLTKLIVQDRMQSGHICEALDPHGSKWPCSAIGAGMDYGAIASRLCEITDLIQERYQYCRDHEIDPNDVDFQPMSLICDEFTNWGQRMNNDLVVSFIRECWSDIRKIDILAIFMAHTNTLEGGLSNATGLASLRDNGCIQIELFAQRDPVTQKAVPTGTGKLYRPGHPPIAIIIRELQPSTTNATNAPTNTPEPYQQQHVQPVTNAEANVQEPTVQGPFSWVPANVREQLMWAVASGQPKAASINALLGISKGGSSAWQKASADWDQLKGMI